MDYHSLFFGQAPNYIMILPEGKNPVLSKYVLTSFLSLCVESRGWMWGVTGVVVIGNRSVL